MNVLGIDIGGSAIKAGLVDPVSGMLLSKQIDVQTPTNFSQSEILAVIQAFATQLTPFDAIGVGFPSAVTNGIIQTAPTTFDHEGWIGFSLSDAVQETMHCRAAVINDADAVGIAEMELGAGEGASGLVIVFTLGTGIGSAPFQDGTLIPNTLLGHIYLRNSDVTAEKNAAARIFDVENLSWAAWGQRLNIYFNHIEHIFSPQMMIISGAISNQFERFSPFISTKAKIAPGKFKESAGIIGAALWSYEKFSKKGANL